MQLALFNDTNTSDRKKSIISLPIKRLALSRFNPRRTRNKEELERLATRIQRNGFEITRAVWVYQAGEVYEVFAGGTRYEAAKLAGLDIIPVVLHEGFTDEEIVRLADVDNENDEYHTPVSIVDVWADYARLHDEEGWTQARIAQAKGVAQQMVSLRMSLHGLPPAVKSFTSQGILSEAHLAEIQRVQVNLYPWLTSGRAWEELATKVARDKAKNGEKTVKATREDIAEWKEFIAYAGKTHQAFAESVTLYELGNPPTPYEYPARERFVDTLADTKARSLPAVKAAERAINKIIMDNLADYQRWLQHKTVEEAEKAKQAEIEQATLARYAYGDSEALLKSWEHGPIRLLLTDPPYGMDYQSNRRWKSKAPDAITGDGKTQAPELLRSVIGAAIPHLAPDAHLLIFSRWDWRDTVDVLEELGLTFKGVLKWEKEEHTAGDVRGSFGLDYEPIIHAVKGSPEVTPRHSTTFRVTRTRETDHPAEKPVELLKQIIECTTHEGDLVVDPFAGQASTLIAAYRLGRDFWGAEVDERHHEKGATRLLKEVMKGA